MRSCTWCGSETINPKFCSHSCSAQFSNRQRRKLKYCKNCESLLIGNTANVYCDMDCSAQHRNKIATEKWLAGETSGLSTNGTVNNTVKKWLRENRGDACEICGWNEINPITGKVPVVADHIDGDWRNNRPDNLRLLCPNHDSLQSTYKALNKGNGRSNRAPHVNLLDS